MHTLDEKAYALLWRVKCGLHKLLLHKLHITNSFRILDHYKQVLFHAILL